jgi:glycosyltransferase involved in cell wall biosynthesis
MNERYADASAHAARPTIKVLHVAETAKGGVGSYIDDVAALQIARHGEATVRVVLPDAHAAQLQRVPPAAQRRFPFAAQRLLNTLRVSRAALAQVREWQPDVVHLHSTLAGFALRPMLALRPGRPCVVYCAHGWAFEREGHATVNRLFELVERIWSHWCDVVVCVSQHERAAGVRIGIASQRLALVNNGVRDVGAAVDVAAARAGWPPGRRRVLFVGRLDRQKGVDVFLAAMRLLEGQAFALIVGAAVVADAAPLALPANVHILGWLGRDEIAACYAAAEVVVIASRWEAFSLVAVEAMRAGRAVVATAVGGLHDVVDDGVTGRLVPPGDAAALAAAVAALGEDELQRLGRNGGRRYAQHFRIERVVDELELLYARFALQRPAPSLAPATASPLEP